MPFGLTFSGGPFIHTWASRKGTRLLKEVLDKLGHERIGWAIASNRSFLSLISPENVKKTALNYSLPKEYLQEFPDEEVYGWIPPEYRSFIEEQTGGKQWAMEQIGFIRKIIVAT